MMSWSRSLPNLVLFTRMCPPFLYFLGIGQTNPMRLWCLGPIVQADQRELPREMDLSLPKSPKRGGSKLGKHLSQPTPAHQARRVMMDCHVDGRATCNRTSLWGSYWPSAATTQFLRGSTDEDLLSTKRVVFLD